MIWYTGWMSGTCFADDTVLYPNPAILSVYLKPSCLTKYVEGSQHSALGWKLNKEAFKFNRGRGKKSRMFGVPKFDLFISYSASTLLGLITHTTLITREKNWNLS